LFLRNHKEKKTSHTALSFERIGTYKQGNIVDEVNDKIPSAGRAIMSHKIVMYKIELVVQERDSFIK
jgi:hypothetical protein